MNYTKSLLATLGGGVALFLAGWLIWGALLMDLLAPYRTKVVGIAKQDPDVILIFISCLAAGALLTLIFQKWAGITTFMTGAKSGAIILLLYGIAADLAVMAEFNILEMPHFYYNILAYLVWGAIGGGVVGWILGRGNN